MQIFLAAALLAIGSAEPATELDYADGALAFEALKNGDLSRAEAQLTASRTVNEHDGAWLLNYGQLLARQGRLNEARAVFRQVADAPDSEVVLASGELIGTREASRLAAQRLSKLNLTSR